MFLNTKDDTVQNCLIIAGSLSVCAITYWYAPPVWWINYLQPELSKKDKSCLSANMV
jgi:hypothetical protein